MCLLEINQVNNYLAFRYTEKSPLLEESVKYFKNEYNF